MGMLAAVLFAGCSSSQMSRIDSNRGIYESWPIETRQAVLDAKVEIGMTPEMVQMAIGKPTEVLASPGGGPGDEVWIYRSGGGLDDSSMMGYPGPSNPGGGYPSGGYPGTYPGGGYPGGGYPGGSSGSTVGISTGRGGTGIVTGGSIGLGGISIGGGGGGMGGPIMTRPTPVDEREVVFRNGVVFRADPPADTK